MDVQGLDLNLLKVFDAIYTHRNFTRAGEALDISQPAVSRAMRRLREVFDDVLFERRPHGVAPTRKADAMAPHVQAALDSTQQTLYLGERIVASDLAVSFRLGTNDYISLLILPRIAQRLRHEAPHVRLMAPNAGHTSATDMLDNGSIDAAIVSERAASGRHGSMPLFTEDYVCIVSGANARVRSGGIDLVTYVSLHHLLVSHETALHGWVDSALQEMGRSRHVAMSIPHFSAAPAVIACTDMVCTLPRRVARLLSTRYDVRVLELPLPSRQHMFHLTWLRRYGSGSVYGWFRNQIAAACADI